jgi:hypothetical protein
MSLFIPPLSFWKWSRKQTMFLIGMQSCTMIATITHLSTSSTQITMALDHAGLLKNVSAQFIESNL